MHDSDGNDADCAFLGAIHDKKASDQRLITLQLENAKVTFRIDTGADETVIPDHVYNELHHTEHICRRRHAQGVTWKPIDR